MTGGAPFFASLVGILVLVAMHWIFSATAQRSQIFSHWIKGNATTIIRDGKVIAGVGVGGAAATTDEKIAQAGAAAAR